MNSRLAPVAPMSVNSYFIDMPDSMGTPFSEAGTKEDVPRDFTASASNSLRPEECVMLTSNGVPLGSTMKFSSVQPSKPASSARQASDSEKPTCESQFGAVRCLECGGSYTSSGIGSEVSACAAAGGDVCACDAPATNSPMAAASVRVGFIPVPIPAGDPLLFDCRVVAGVYQDLPYRVRGGIGVSTGRLRMNCETIHFSPRAGDRPACSMRRSGCISRSTLPKKRAPPRRPLWLMPRLGKWVSPPS